MTEDHAVSGMALTEGTYCQIHESVFGSAV